MRFPSVIRRRREAESEQEARDDALRRPGPWVYSFFSGDMTSGRLEFVAGSPARFQVGRFGGSLWVGMYPQPAPWCT